MPSGARGISAAALLAAFGALGCSAPAAAVDATVPAPMDMSQGPPPPLPPVDPFVRGIVKSGGMPFVGARIRVQGVSDSDGPSYVESGPGGWFDLPLPGRQPGDALVVTAGAEGFRSRAIDLPPAGRDAAVELEPLAPDDPTYAFIAAAEPGSGCASCHATQARAWAGSPHAQAARDPLFLDEYRRHLGWWQRLPEKSSDQAIFAGPFLATDRKGDVGKIFMEGQDFLQVVGDTAEVTDCLKCHSPAYAFAGGVDARAATLALQPEVFSEGVGCDVCHKVRGLRYAYEADLLLPGFAKAEMGRPPPGEPVTGGPLDDVTSPDMPSTYAPIFERSEFCATCHSDGRVLTLQLLDELGQPVGQPVSRAIWGEDTFREWRFLPGTSVTVQPLGGGVTYQAHGEGPFTGGGNYAGRPLACQDCHMNDPPPDLSTGERIAAYAGLEEARIATPADPVKRDARNLHHHGMEGRTPRYLAWATELSVKATRANDEVQVEVRVENRHTGHSFPSGLPDRNVLLLVEASDAGGPLQQLDGPVLPSWASGDGVTDPARDLAGRPGHGFARVLAAADGEEPVFYLRGVTSSASDNRLLQGMVDASHYTFATQEGPATVRVRVLHRRRFKVQTDRYLAANPAEDKAQFETEGDLVELTVQ